MQIISKWKLINSRVRIKRVTCGFRIWTCCNCSPRRRVERYLPVTIGGEDRRRPPPCLESPLRGWREVEDYRVQSARPRHLQGNGNRALSCTKKPPRSSVLPVRWPIAADASIARYKSLVSWILRFVLLFLNIFDITKKINQNSKYHR